MDQADGGDLYRVQPEAPPSPRSQEGIHAWPFGGYAPIGFYRPVPIVRFAGTILLQFLLNLALYDLLILAPRPATVAAGVLVALALAVRAWMTWLGQAARRWTIATFAALALNVLYLAFLALAPAG